MKPIKKKLRKKFVFSNFFLFICLVFRTNESRSAYPRTPSGAERKQGFLSLRLSNLHHFSSTPKQERRKMR